MLLNHLDIWKISWHMCTKLPQGNQIVDKGNLVFLLIFIIINEERMIELGHHHLAICKELMDLYNSHRRLRPSLKLIATLYERINL